MSILYANIKATVNIHVCIVYCNIRKIPAKVDTNFSEQKLVVLTAECVLSNTKTETLGLFCGTSPFCIYKYSH